MKDEIVSKLSAFKVLYIEDEDGIRNNIQEILKHLFKETITAKNASDGFNKYIQHRPDLIITDIRMPPGETGLELIKKIRASDSKTRIIITSAHTDLEYMLEATELHLVKYIIKPITQEKLVEAFDAFLKTHDTNKIFTIIENWHFDYSKSIVYNKDETFNLTKKENIFLKLLLTKNRIITYEEMETHIWDEDSVMTQNAMRLFIKNFRKKLPPKCLKNIQGTGYRLQIESNS